MIAAAVRLLACFAALAASACETLNDCPTPGGSPPLITVVDAVTGAPICDATLLVIAGYDAIVSDAAVERSATMDAAAYCPGCVDGAVLTIGPGGTDDAGVCTYIGGPFAGSLQVSRAGYQTVDVYDVYTTIPSGACSYVPAPPEVVRITLRPVGS
jgi:hypothetical protein